MSLANKVTPIARHHRKPAPGKLPRSPVAAPVSSKSYCFVGLLAVAVFMIQAVGHWRWPWLTTLQSDDGYKQISGLALLAFIAYQWRFSVLRANGEMHRALAMTQRHKWLGALAPLLFYAHAQGFGYAYTQMLGVAFFAIVVSGLCNSEITRIRKPWFRPTWIVIHVGLSSALLFLLGYHVYITYAFE